ncbi:hypothetical protein AZE42_02442, partial [Rhizopogon vesiculosus]
MSKVLNTVIALILNNVCLYQAVVQELVQWHKVRHFNVVSVFGIFHRDMTPFLVTPWITGANLNVFLTQHHRFLSPVDCMSLIRDVAAGLDCLHSFSIVHGSLIGANILIDNGRRACLTDFGLGSIRGPIQGSAFLGTSSDAPGAIRWTATELVAKDVERPTIHSDIYSFGSVALQIATGKVPWSEFEDEFDVVVKIGRGLVPLKPEDCDIKDSLWEFIQQCWEFIPEDRPTSLSALDFAEIEFRATLGCEKFPTPQPSHGASSHTPVSASSPAFTRAGTNVPTQSRPGAGSGGPMGPVIPASPRMALHEEVPRREQEKDTLSAPRRASVGLRIGGFQESSAPSLFQMDNFESIGTNVTSDGRFPPHLVAAGCEMPVGHPSQLVDRKVKALLSMLTMETFDSISDKIIHWVNEKDGRTLAQVTYLVLDKAAEETALSEMYARLCRKMMEQISPDVREDRIKNLEGKPIAAGGQLFRKYLLNRCQEDFERGWFAKEATAAAKASHDQATKAANEKKGTEEAELYSDEYYAVQKAKRQGLGLIKFIGELFKLQMLTERIMHECVKKLLGNIENPEEEEIESLCQLLKTLGKSTDVSSRIQLMLQDVIELRERKWVSRNAFAAPMMIAAFHEVDRAAAERESYNRQASLSRGRSRRGGKRNQEFGPDGWAVAGSPASRSPPNPKAGDFSQFGKISKGAPMVVGSSSVFAGGKKDSKRDPLSRTSSSSNMFHML